MNVISVRVTLEVYGAQQVADAIVSCMDTMGRHIPQVIFKLDISTILEAFQEAVMSGLITRRGP